MTREEAIDIIKCLAWHTRPNEEDTEQAIEALEQEPYEDFDRKGHWIEHPHEAGSNWEYSRYECSECHDWAEDDSDYCPNCGCRME